MDRVDYIDYQSFNNPRAGKEDQTIRVLDYSTFTPPKDQKKRKKPLNKSVELQTKDQALSNCSDLVSEFGFNRDYYIHCMLKKMSESDSPVANREEPRYNQKRPRKNRSNPAIDLLAIPSLFYLFSLLALIIKLN